jgi:hypothetical protein
MDWEVIMIVDAAGDELIEDLTLLYFRLADLGIEFRNGEVYLDDIARSSAVYSSIVSFGS